jgi:biotin synthase-like enzyme
MGNNLNKRPKLNLIPINFLIPNKKNNFKKLKPVKIIKLIKEKSQA